MDLKDFSQLRELKEIRELRELNEIREDATGPNSETTVAAPNFRNVKIQVEKKGRAGKTATILYGFTCSDAEIVELAQRLKRSLGVGGSVRDGEILIQGNHADKIRKLLNGQWIMDNG